MNFMSQDNYMADILKKIDFATMKTASTPMESNKALIKDEEADSVDVHLYRSVIGSLMYLTASRPDIMFVVCACARFQVTPKMSHLRVVKRIFRYLKGNSQRRCLFLTMEVDFWQCKKQTIVANSTTESEYVAAANCCRQIFSQRLLMLAGLTFQLLALDYLISEVLFEGSLSESSVRSDLLFNDEDGIACLTNDEIFENLALMGYEQLSTIFKKESQYESLLLKTPIKQFPYELQTEAHIEHNYSHRIYFSKENKRKTQKHRRAKQVTVLPQTVWQSRRHRKPIGGVLAQIMQVESSNDDLDEEDASKQGRENDDKTEELNLTDGADTKVIMEDKGSGKKGGTADQVSTARPEVSVPVNVSAATPSTPPTITTIFSDEDLTIAQTLVKMRSEKAKEKEKGVVLIDKEEPPRLNRSTTTLQPLPTIDPKDKGKGVLVEEEPEKPVKVKRRDQGLAQIESNAELAQRLHEEELAELDRAQKERHKQEEATSAALVEEFDEIQARIDDDHELTVRLTHEEQEKYTIEERARLLAEFFERRKKQLAAERAEAIRNKPPIRN
ncbi:hypothetical protein Tco_1183833 [Tanacetum coccineum]